eukprot:gnl/MRDRNA2_/MRDRNA2_129263_c0_seq1.p1 gnl/MRDRNA2_/MRDRNA2_129263_c0~~gnl/MRDRNA2_/MRDRNA2_129263_c0_seq1.p1  ORF type:complete len:294 (-),score=78.36 gnl/MRDRNA2_/MRDRNA2_129263_c0_seq1:23-883(-)
MAAVQIEERQLQYSVGPPGSKVEVAIVTGGVAPDCDTPGGAVAATRVSPDAQAFLQWLAEDPKELPTESGMIELGAGHGLVGISCAALRPVSRLVLTDVETSFAERSVEANSPELQERVIVRRLPFGEAAALQSILDELKQSSPDQPIIAVGAAVTYWECVYSPLGVTLQQLCAAGGQAILGYFMRDWKVEKRFWTKILPKLGLQVDTLWECLIEEPDNDTSFAPTCSRTAGEWNARVYRISQKAAESGAAESTGECTGETLEEQPWLAYKGYDNEKKGQKKGKKK